MTLARDDSATSGATTLALAASVASALLLVLAGLTADLVVGLLAVLALTVTTFAALWAAVVAKGRTGPRLVLAASAGLIGSWLVLTLSSSPRALVVPLTALLVAAAARGSAWFLGAAALLGLASLVVVL